MIRVLCLWLFLCATASFGQNADLPALFDVTGVEPTDTLNIRATPSGTSAIVGRLDAVETGIEVIATNASATWGMVNIGEATGWVSMRYLVRQPQFGFPRITACYGTEPFWSLSVDGDSLTLQEMGDATETRRPIWRTQSANQIGVYGFGAGSIVGVLERESCNDGMSDQAFGLSVNLLTGQGRGTQMLSGCCSLSAK